MAAYLSDTSAINRLLEDRERDAIVAALTSSKTVCVSGLNVLEAVRTKSVHKRRDLLQLLRGLSGTKNPLELPNTLIRRLLAAYERRAPSVTHTVLGDSLVLWDVLQDPGTADEAFRERATEWHAALELEFRATHEAARPHMQDLQRRHGRCFRSAAELYRAYASSDALIASVVGGLYLRETGSELPSGEERRLLSSLPSLVAFLVGWTHAIFRRGIAPENYGKKNAGTVDLWFGTYLPHCNEFITADCRQLHAMRFVRAAVGGPCKVRSFAQFRTGTLGGARHN